jgi:hypothetical protein
MEPVVEQRARVAAIEDQLASLRARYELAMSTFKFDEANALQQQIAALEAEERVLGQMLPRPTIAPEPPTGIVPTLGKRARRGRTRRLR